MDVRIKKEHIKSYITAANLLPDNLWHEAFDLSEEEQLCAEEFRLRVGCGFEVISDGKAIRRPADMAEIKNDDLEGIIAGATKCSLHSYENDIAHGFITAEGGHRVGICGSLAYSPTGQVRMGEITSLNIRIAKQCCGIGGPLAEHLTEGNENVLIMSPPGIGKTTLLRDLCRLLSYRKRVCIADCRGEIGGGASGKMMFDLGYCDVMRGGTKTKVISMLITAMSPEILAVDEITAEEDIDAMLAASYTGCRLMATAHGASPTDLERRPLYRKLDEAGIFDKVILLERTDGHRTLKVFERSRNDKSDWTCDDSGIVFGYGHLDEQ